MIESFSKEHRFLSNFAHSDVKFEGLVYPTVEHAYQAAKTLVPHYRVEMWKMATPAKAKEFGKHFPLRLDWNIVKLPIMEDLLRKKFANFTYAEQLLMTEEEYLVEGNWWHDGFWGSCKCSVCGNHGLNHLGKLLMKIRQELRRGR